MQLPNLLFFKHIEALTSQGQQVQIRIRGHSMRPLLRNGRDTVVLAPCTQPSTLRPGDIVLFRHAGRHLLHRIIEIDHPRPFVRHFTLAGDGNYNTREHCGDADIVARAVRVIRTSGRSIECRSHRWQWLSHSWLGLPQIARKWLLALMWRMGCK